MSLSCIDLFCGAGGSSEGARQAGARILWAANHNALAVQVHQRNHPETAHACQDLMQADFRAVPRCDVVLASPACQGGSQAGRPGRAARVTVAAQHAAYRSTPWAVVSCLEAVRSRVCIVENTLELRDWECYPSWLDALSRLGYRTREHVIDCASLGVPQERVRLFITAALDGAIELDLPTASRTTARSIMDAKATRWGPWRKLPPAARRRVERSRERHGDEFVAHYVSDDYGHSMDEPLPTVTTKHQFCWVRGDQRRMFTGREYARAMGFPDSYALTGFVSHDCRLVGNAVPPPVMRAIVRAVGAAM